MAYISVADLNFSYNENIALKNVNFTVDKRLNVSIIGPSGSGKTTLLKIMAASTFGNGNVVLNGEEVGLSNIMDIKKDIGIVLDDGVFFKETVSEELKHNLYNLLISSSEGSRRLSEIFNYFDLFGIADEKLEDIKLSDKMLVKILTVLITEPKTICLDDVLGYLNKDDKERLFSYLKRKNIRFVAVMSDIEDVMYSDYMICLYNGSVAVEGSTLSVIQEEKLLRRLGFNLPFYVDLSIQLSYYGIVEELCLSKEDLVRSIWK